MRRWLGCLAMVAACGGSAGDDDGPGGNPDGSMMGGGEVDAAAPDAPLAPRTTLYFAAIQGGSGTELWITDGSGDGTRMVADINPSGNGLPFGYNGVEAGGVTYFRANDGTRGMELWLSDGTEAGTRIVDDVYPGATGSEPSAVWVSGDGVLYSARNEVVGYELWHATQAGAELVANINPTGDPMGHSFPDQFVAYGDKVVFTAGITNGNTELHEYDGTTVTLVEDIFPGGFSGYPLSPTVFGDYVLFSATTGNMVTGRELWRYDGADAVMLEDLAPGGASSDPSEFVELGGVLYFTADSGAGRTVYQTDGTPGGATAPTWVAEAGVSAPRNLTRLGDRLLFAAADGTHGEELWVFDGTSVTMLGDFNPGAAESFPSPTVIIDGWLYFLSATPTGRALYRTDGTEAGTEDLGALLGYTFDDCTIPLGVASGKLIFGFDSDGADGLELWATDFTAAGTEIISDIQVYGGGKC